MSTFFDRIKLFFSREKEFRTALYGIMGFLPHNIDLYRIAFAHKSQQYKSKKAGNKPLNNERLEFLGDAVLETVVSDIVYRRFPNKREGFLTNTRSKIVSRESLGQLAKDLGIDRLVQSQAHARTHNSYLAGNSFEALMGAIYLDRGFNYAYRFVEKRIIGAMLDLETVASKEVNFKSKLLEWSQKNRIRMEWKEDTSRSENASSPSFHTKIIIEGNYAGEGHGFSKKESHQAAAKEALTRLRHEENFLDTVFRSKEQRTAMSAEEFFAPPKIDEIEQEVAQDQAATTPQHERKNRRNERGNRERDTRKGEPKSGRSEAQSSRNEAQSSRGEGNNARSEARSNRQEAHAQQQEAKGEKSEAKTRTPEAQAEGEQPRREKRERRSRNERPDRQDSSAQRSEPQAERKPRQPRSGNEQPLPDNSNSAAERTEASAPVAEAFAPEVIAATLPAEAGNTQHSEHVTEVQPAPVSNAEAPATEVEAPATPHATVEEPAEAPTAEAVATSLSTETAATHHSERTTEVQPAPATTAEAPTTEVEASAQPATASASAEETPVTPHVAAEAAAEASVPEVAATPAPTVSAPTADNEGEMPNSEAEVAETQRPTRRRSRRTSPQRADDYANTTLPPAEQSHRAEKAERKVREQAQRHAVEKAQQQLAEVELPASDSHALPTVATAATAEGEATAEHTSSDEATPQREPRQRSTRRTRQPRQEGEERPRRNGNTRRRSRKPNEGNAASTSEAPAPPQE